MEFALFTTALLVLFLFLVGAMVVGLVGYRMVSKEEGFEDALMGALRQVKRRVADLPDDDSGPDHP